MAITLSSCSETTPIAPTTTSIAAPAQTTSRPITETTAEVDLVSRGMSLAARNGCAACHSTDGSALVGPTWQGLFGKEETLVDGSRVQVDEDYLRESILDPNVKIVEGFVPNIMPDDFAEKLSAEDIEALIAYIKSLE